MLEHIFLTCILVSEIQPVSRYSGVQQQRTARVHHAQDLLGLDETSTLGTST